MSNTPLWTLNPLMQDRAKTLARQFISAHHCGEKEEARGYVRQLETLIEGYFLALGVVIPQEACQALRAELIVQTREQVAV